MPEPIPPTELTTIWKEQPEEPHVMIPREFLTHRARDLYTSTRSEILTSLGAAIFFVAIIGWRMTPVRDQLLLMGLASVIVYVLITLYRFRRKVWTTAEDLNALAAPGIEFYRAELIRRRDHLRNIWLWHGPLALACVILVAVAIRNATPNIERLRNATPLFILLVCWIGFGIHRRRRQAREIQRELEEIPSV